jgi:uncharacterized protein YcbK (DUF882 family)
MCSCERHFQQMSGHATQEAYQDFFIPGCSRSEQAELGASLVGGGVGAPALLSLHVLNNLVLLLI